VWLAGKHRAFRARGDSGRAKADFDAARHLGR